MPRSELSTPSSLIRTNTTISKSRPYPQPSTIQKLNDKKMIKIKEEFSYENPNDLIPSSSPTITISVPSSSSSSADEDGSSDYNPNHEATPKSKYKSAKRDVKPNLSDLDSGSQLNSDSESDSDRPKKKLKTSTKSPRTTPTKKGIKKEPEKEESTSSRSTSGTPRKSNGIKAVGRTWTAEEDWLLFKELHPKVSKPDWGGVAGKVGNGRDSKSCQNRYALMSKKLESVIKSIGGA